MSKKMINQYKFQKLYKKLLLEEAQQAQDDDIDQDKGQIFVIKVKKPKFLKITKEDGSQLNEEQMKKLAKSLSEEGMLDKLVAANKKDPKERFSIRDMKEDAENAQKKAMNDKEKIEGKKQQFVKAAAAFQKDLPVDKLANLIVNKKFELSPDITLRNVKGDVLGKSLKQFMPENKLTSDNLKAFFTQQSDLPVHPQSIIKIISDIKDKNKGTERPPITDILAKANELMKKFPNFSFEKMKQKK